MKSLPADLSARSGRRVLVVEDEVRVRTMLGQALATMNFEPAFAASAESAVKALATAAFDILILDLNLPGQNGIDFLEQVRRQQDGIQVIILTGFGDLDAAKKAIRLDVVDFLTKPCALGDLEVALDRASKRRRAQWVDQAAASSIELADEKPSFASRPNETPGDAATTSMEDVEQRAILAALQRHQGNRTAAATELGISVRKLYYRLGEYQKKGLI